MTCQGPVSVINNPSAFNPRTEICTNDGAVAVVRCARYASGVSWKGMEAAYETSDMAEGSARRSRRAAVLKRKKKTPSTSEEAEKLKKQMKDRKEYDALANKGRAGRRAVERQAGNQQQQPGSSRRQSSRNAAKPQSSVQQRRHEAERGG